MSVPSWNCSSRNASARDVDKDVGWQLLSRPSFFFFQRNFATQQQHNSALHTVVQHTEATIMATTNTLATLPAEMSERIAQAADKFDLPALRLVSRECDTKSLRTITQAHFTRRSVLLMDVASLEDAIYLSKHGIFGKAVQHLSICMDDMPPIPDGPRQYSLPLKKADRTKAGNFHNALLQRAVSRASNAAFNALTVLLLHLRNNVTTIDIADIFTVVNQDKERAPAMDDDTREFLTIPNRDELEMFFNFILEALAATEVPIQELRIRQRYLILQPDRIKEKRMFSKVMMTIKTLELATCVEEGAITTDIDDFVKVLASAPVLQNLKLKVASENYHCWHLDDFDADSTTLVQLITLRQFQKLERFIIKGATLGARAIAGWAKKQLALCYLELDHITLQDAYQLESEYGDVREAITRLSGSADVKMGRFIG